MIRRHGSTLRALLMLGDGAMAAIVLVIVYNARFLVPDAAPPDQRLAEDPRWLVALGLVYALGWVFILYLEGEYRLRAHWSARTEVVGVARATFWLALASYAVLFLFDMDPVSRLFTLILFPIQGLVTMGTRVVLRGTFMFARRRGKNRRFVLVVGTSDRAREFAQTLEDHSMLGLEVMGLLGDKPKRGGAPLRWPYLGKMEEFDRILRSSIVDEVAICLPASDTPMVEAIARICQEEGKIVRIPLDVPKVDAGRRFVEDLEGTAVLSFVRGPDQLLSLAVKRFVDIAVASVALLVLSPLLLGVAVFIRIRDGSPVLFRQERVGMQGRPFTMIKFRTMVPDAEERLDEVAHLSQIKGPAFKVADDPRLSATGRFLRRASIDELPQLWNVLKGEMSLVGPRPAPPREVKEYDLWHRRRLSMKPGMTGLWQVSARADQDFDARATLDLAYIDRWSLWLDLRIVARTLPAVFGLGGQ